jgi:PD-(D/E)XK endonuclease
VSEMGRHRFSTFVVPRVTRCCLTSRPAVTLGQPAPTISSHPVDVGQRTEGAILAELLRRGYRVLLPFGVNQRYDLVLDMGDRFLRVQCKTGRLRAGVIRFATRSTRRNSRELSQRGYAGEADVFIVYCPDNRGVYVVPVDEAPATGMYLRLAVASNGQSQRIRWAKDFELPG